MPAGNRVGATSRFVFVIAVALMITPAVPAMSAVPERVHRDETDKDQ